MRHRTALAILSVLTSAAAGQDAAGLLKKVDATARSLNTYELEQAQYTESRYPSATQQSEIRLRVQAARPGKYRMEGPGSPHLRISNGKEWWEVDPRNNEFTRTLAPSREWPGMLGIELKRIENARTVRQETLDLPNAPVLCTVVEAEMPWPRKSKPVHVTFWVDTQRSLVLKRIEVWDASLPDDPPSSMIETTVVQSVKLNPPLQDSLFQFTPPEGAVLVKELRPGRKSPLIGQTVPEFELKATSGERITPASVHGSIAVLHFSVHGEVDKTLPFLELLHRNPPARDLKVLVVAMLPGDKWAEALASEGYTLPTAIDTGRVAKSLGLVGSSVVVLDRNGTILYLSDGSDFQPEVVRALKSVSAW